jgi:class 3 adenylate cyclase
VEPQIQYCKTSDNVNIAFAVIGQGPVLLFARALLAPGLDDEIRRPTPFWPSLTHSHSVVLWDLRGVGLSGNASEIGFHTWLADMEAVADAAGADALDLVGINLQCHVAIAYAARQPARVKRLVLYAPNYTGFSQRKIQPDWLFNLLPDNWDDFTNILSLRMWGWEKSELAERWSERLRTHWTPDEFLRLMDAQEATDATAEAHTVKAPTLVLDDRPRPFERDVDRMMSEAAAQLAADIPGARLALLGRGDAPIAQVMDRFLSGEADFGGAIPKRSGSGGTSIILFADIADSTALTERLGDAAFRDKARELDEALRRAITSNGGTAIDGKLLGDGVLATFGAAREAIACASACHTAATAVGLALHVGIHAGDVIRERAPDGRDNVYGGAVNIAARIADQSVAGETLVSATVRDLARTSAGVSFEDRGERELKGVSEPVRVFAVQDDI